MGLKKEIFRDMDFWKKSDQPFFVLNQSGTFEKPELSVAGIAHDLRNMIGTIHSYMEIMEDEIKENPQILSYIRYSKHSARLALSLLSRLLEPDKKKPGYINTGKIIHDIAVAMLSKPEIEWTFEEHGSITNLYMDQVLFERILENLLANALTALKGKGKISIKTSVLNTRELNLPFKPNKDYMYIAIADNGPGIHQERLKKIKSGEIKILNEGHGMGLAIVDEILKSVDGYFTIESTPGHGTTVHVYLPINEP